MKAGRAGLALRSGVFSKYWKGVTPPQGKIPALVKNLLQWFAANALDLPWRRTKDPYAIHVSEIILYKMADRLLRTWHSTIMAQQVED